MADIAMLVAEEYERRVKKCGERSSGGGGAEIRLSSCVDVLARRLEGSASWVKKRVGKDNMEPKTQIGVAAIDGLFSA